MHGSACARVPAEADLAHPTQLPRPIHRQTRRHSLLRPSVCARASYRLHHPTPSPSSSRNPQSCAAPHPGAPRIVGPNHSDHCSTASRIHSPARRHAPLSLCHSTHTALAPVNTPPFSSAGSRDSAATSPAQSSNADCERTSSCRAPRLVPRNKPLPRLATSVRRGPRALMSRG